MDFDDLLRFAVKHNASDLHIKVGSRPLLRIDGNLVPLKNVPTISQSYAEKLSQKLMNSSQQEKFSRCRDVDLSHGVDGLGRFRVNIFLQRGSFGLVVRTLSDRVPGLAELNLPPALKRLAALRRGLILVTGTTGSGKSTTMASVLDQINSQRHGHIITIEDPIEFLLQDRRCVVNQREVGSDTPDFVTALRAAMRQDPDVVMIGEMRDLETIETALQAAETGHLVMSTLHTTDAGETINRLISFFPPHRQRAARSQFAGVIAAVVSQRLVLAAAGKGRVPAVELMIATSRIRELIADEERTREIRGAISEGTETYGMQTFDQSLMKLVHNDLISIKEALRHCSNPDDFRLRLSGVASSSDSQWEHFESGY